MIGQYLMKKPVLVIAALISVLFIMDMKRRGIWQQYKDRFVPSSCKAALVKLDRRLPGAHWKTSCDKNIMTVTIEHPGQTVPKELEKYKMLLYREMANALTFIAENSPSDNLERTDWVKLEYKHQKNQIDAITAGKFLVKLQTLKNPGLIAEHFKHTIKVKESIKSL